MIDIENYKRAIAWLRRGMNELRQEPERADLQLDLLHRFEVTHNVSEGLLREAYDALKLDEQAPYISLRELLRRAAEDGLLLCPASEWLRYCVLLEDAKQAWLETTRVDLDAILPELPAYAHLLENFAQRLEKKAARFA